MLSFSFTPFPVLETERLVLRNISEADADAFFELRSDPEIMKYVPRPLARKKEDVLPLIATMIEGVEKALRINWGITLRDNPRLVGAIGFVQINPENHRAEIGYILHPSCQGKGVMNEAMDAVLAYGRDVMKLHAVEGVVHPDNTASCRVLEKNGFSRDAYFKDYILHKDAEQERYLDAVVYSRIL